MIVLDRPLERTLDRCVKEHCDRQRTLGLYGSVGFLLGSTLEDSIHVAHIAMCALPETAMDQGGDKNSRLVDAEWIADHGARLVRLLPGGIDIVGFLWLADKKLAFQPRVMLAQAFSSISKHSAFLSSLKLRPGAINLAVVVLETPLGRPQGYIIDSSRRGTDGFQTKVSFAQLEWIGVESSGSFHLTVPMCNVQDDRAVSNFQTQFSNAIYQWTENYFTTECVLVNGILKTLDEPIRERNKKARGANVRNIRIETFLSAGKRGASNGEGRSHAEQSVGVAEVNFDVDVCAAVLAKGTVRDAVLAVKQHLLRTLSSRAELHYESTDVVEDEPKDRVCVHQLPRSAYVSLPSQPAIRFTDYLFESDSKADARDSFRDLLSLNFADEEIDDTGERHLEAGDLAQIVAARESSSSVRVQRSSSSTSSSSTVIVPVVGKPLPVNYVVLMSIIVALLAIVVYLLFRSLGE